MYILMISRGIPTKEEPQWGCFEKDQAEALVALGHKVVVLSVDERYRRFKRKRGVTQIHINGVEYYNWYLLPGKLFSLISKKLDEKYTFACARYLFKKILENHGKPDVIYAQWFWNMLLGLDLRARYDIPVVGIEHASIFGLSSVFVNERPKHKTIKGRYAFSNVDALITVSKNLQAGIKREFGIDSVVVNNLVGGDFVYNAPIGHEHINFVSVGTLEYRKGFDVLIEAVYKLNRKDVFLNIIGEGAERENLQKLIDGYGLANRIKLLGKMQKSQIVDVMRRSDAFVFGTRHENFSVAILEALSQGLPSIVTDCGGARDCVNEANGIIVDVDSVEQMADAMQTLIANLKNYDRKAIAEDFQRRFSPDSIARKITMVLEEAVKAFHTLNKR